MKNTKLKRVISLFLSVLAISTMTFTISASATKSVESGICGDSLKWIIDDEGTLFISGTGDMDNYDPNNNTYAPWYLSIEKIRMVDIADGVTSIGYGAFIDCKNLISIVIPESITSIGDDAFFDCISLKNITIPNGVTTIGNNAFFNCRSITSITIPESVASLGSGSFQGCSNLNNIVISESNINIESSTFRGCSKLTSITIPESVTNIGSFAFGECPSLTSIKIPDSVITIDNWAFDGCFSLSFVYYAGSENDRNYIDIIGFNDYLENATWIYNYDGNLSKSTAIAIKYYKESIRVKYKSTDYYTAIVENSAGEDIRWFVNGEYVGSGESYTVKNATRDYTIQCKTVDANGKIVESQIENVYVGLRFNYNFFEIIITYFQRIIEDLLLLKY